MSGVVAGTVDEKSSYQKQFLWSNAEQSKKWLPRRDVTTSRRHQVTTSGQQCRSQQFNHVATSPRRDVTTSRRHHVATSPRRDVSSKICISSFNVRTARKLGHREAYERRHGFPEQSDTVFEGVPGICTAFHVFDILEY